jgi:hypothetical protein
VNAKTLNTSLSGNASLDTLIKEITQQSNHFDSKLKTVYLPDIRKVIQRLLKLYYIDQITYRKILQGVETIDCNGCKVTENYLHENRLANIKASLGLVEELYFLAEAIHTSNTNLDGAVNSLKAFREELQNLVTQFEPVVQERKSINDVLFNIGLSNLNQLGGNTYVSSFETRSKLSIAPDFGIVTTLGKDGSNPYPFVPYLGFHINLRPINRDITFWSYHHKPLHHWSILFGWSLVSIDNGPKQLAGADSVASFFSKGKGTLLTGVGFRLGNVVRITGGGMWYFKYQPSAVNTNFYDQRRLKYWPFIGVSLDLSIKDLLNGISDVLTGAPRTFRPPNPPATSI